MQRKRSGNIGGGDVDVRGGYSDLDDIHVVSTSLAKRSKKGKK